MNVCDQLRESTRRKLLNREMNCEKELTLSIISGKWKLVVLWHLGFEGPHRFNEIQRLFKNISHRILTKQLRELEMDGVIERTIYPTSPPKVEYSITQHGSTMLPIVQAMYEWGQQHMGYYIARLDQAVDDKKMTPGSIRG